MAAEPRGTRHNISALAALLSLFDPFAPSRAASPLAQLSWAPSWQRTFFRADCRLSTWACAVTASA